MTDIYYRLSDSAGNSLYFVGAFDETFTRSLWENEVPFTKNIMISDQVSTRDEIAITGYVKAGTSMPYATVKAAETAIQTLVSTDYLLGFTLQGGDWNGSSWSSNSNYPFYRTGILVSMIRMNFKEGESYSDGEISITINCKIGDVF